jgi:hypothetical protein
MAAAKAFFRSAKSVTGIVPSQVTTDWHDLYLRAIRSALGQRLVHRTSAYKNVWPAPSARVFSTWLDQSTPTYPASEASSRPRWRSARPGPHNNSGVERHS